MSYPVGVMTQEKVPIAVFVSGRGRTLRNLQTSIDAGALPAKIVLVVGSRACPATSWAVEHGIATEIAPRMSGAEVEQLIQAHGVAWIVLAGYLKRLAIPVSMHGRVVNIHPGLLPKFGGRGMYGDRVHQAVIEAGETESGCTVHLVDDVYDHGEIIEQARCEVMADDTTEALAARVFALECELYPRVLAELFLQATAQ